MISVTEMRERGRYWIRSARRVHGVIAVTGHCIVCHRRVEAKCAEIPLRAWLDGDVTIQGALPHLNADQREWMVSGFCGACYEDMNEETEPW